MKKATQRQKVYFWICTIALELVLICFGDSMANNTYRLYVPANIAAAVCLVSIFQILKQE